MTLQNHLGDLETPVRPRWRWIRSVMEVRMRTARKAENRRASVLFVSGAVPAAFAAMIAQSAWTPDAAADPGLAALAASLGFAALIGLLVVCAANLPRVGTPVRDQRRWLALSGAHPVTAEQQSLLALDAASDHETRAWNSSLAYQPAWALLPDAVRRRWDDGRRGTPFASLVMPPAAVLRQQLDEHFRVVTGQDVHLAVADRFAGGGLSGRLRRALEDPRAVARLAALTGLDELDVQGLAEPADGRPASLAWGADVQHVVLLVRMAHMGGLLGADEAWTLLERAGEVAAAVYDGWADYDRGVLVGTALAEGSLDAVERLRRATAEVRSGSWPAARAALPVRSPSAVLPPAVLGRWQPA